MVDGTKRQQGQSLRLSNSDALQFPVELLVLLEEDEGGNGVGAQANEARHPAAESPSKTLLAADIPQQAHNAVTPAFRRGSRHDTGLDHIHRTADGGSDEAGEERGCEVGANVVAHAHLLNAEALEDIVRSQL